MRFLFAGALLIAFIMPSWALAQTTDDSWAVPLNLSHSGVAVNPAMVIDSKAVVHAIWQDDLANFVYARLEGDQWSAPETTNLNFLFEMPLPDEPTGPQLAIYTGPNPLFMAGPGEYIFAFWISPQGKLFTSKVRNLNFENVAAWESERLITPEVASFAVAIDASGEWHLAYLRTVEDSVSPAGIYYTRSKNKGLNWAIPTLLYESPYLRTLGEGEAHLSLATTSTEDSLHVFVGWDNRPRKEVLLAQSADGGENWEKPMLVAGPAPNSGLTGPFNIHVSANQNSIVLVWQSGRPGGACSQIYQFSNDRGNSWSDPQPMIEDLLGCAKSNKFITELANSPEDPLYFLTETQSQVFMSVWNGRQWSAPQAQPILSGFEEPEIYTEVVYGCLQASLLRERLYIIGCDEGRGGDVWITSRNMGVSTSGLSSPVWSQPSPITSENLKIESVELMTTDDGLTHAFFSQHQDSVIYYTYWNGELWSRIAPVFELPDGKVGGLAIATGPGNELFLSVPNDQGALYFSRATSGNAATKSRWATATQLETSHDGKIGSVDIAWSATGTVYLTYSVPVNDQRGIYLVQSEDYGSSWSEPLQVFNGEAEGFDLVGAPSLFISENNLLHIVWKQQSIRGDGVPQSLALYYTRSTDGGHVFNEARLIVEESVIWQEIVADNKGNLHLLWQDTRATIWDQISYDGGRSWNFPQGLPAEGTTAAVALDSVRQIHLLDAGLRSIDHWLWNGNRWNSEEPLHLSLASQQESPVDLLASAINKQGKIVVVLAVSTGAGNSPERTLLYSARTLKLPQKQNVNWESLTQTLLPPALTPGTSTPERLPTPANMVASEQTNSQTQTDRNETDNPISSLTIALLPVALLLLIVLGIVIRRASRARD